MGTGWPFLVASGRRRDYSTLLAPQFLVADLDYGILDQAVRPASEPEPPTVVEVRTPHGRRLTLVYATHLLTAVDLAEPGAGPEAGPGAGSGAGPEAAPGAGCGAASGAAGAEPRDEHGRPLRLIYGFASPDAWISEPAEADLSHARTAALTTYRRFLADEERVAVAPSYPFPLSSRTADRPAARDLVAPSSAGGPGVGVLPRAARWLAGATVVAALAVAGILWGVGRPSPAPVPVACPSVTATPTRSPSADHPSAGPSSTCAPTPPRQGR